MPCFAPLKAWKSRELSENGKRQMLFSPKDAYSDLPVDLPCGQCIGCRLRKSQEIAMRCMHEASLHEDNSFLTLTYSDEFLPAHGSLVKPDLQKFLKRLRRRSEPRRFRFLASGEYGDNFGRPHYHVLLFGLDFADKEHFSTRGDYPVFRSANLEKIWPYGLSEIGAVSRQSAGYVAQYCVKKVTGDFADEYYRRLDPQTGEMVPVEREFATMSRRPALGKNWFEKYHDEVYREDSVVVHGGAKVKPPAYYDKLKEKQDADAMRLLKQARKRAFDRSNMTPERLRTRELCTASRLSTFSKETF